MVYPLLTNFRVVFYCIERTLSSPWQELNKHQNLLVFVIYNKLFYVGFQATIISCLCSCAVFVDKLKVSEEITIFTALIWIEVWKKIFQPAVSWMF